MSLMPTDSCENSLNKFYNDNERVSRNETAWLYGHFPKSRRIFFQQAHPFHVHAGDEMSAY